MDKSWQSTLPAGKHGSAEITRFTVSEDASSFSAIRGEYVPAGDYTRLSINGKLVMSDTPKEKRDHWDLFSHARGHVLLNGLGLGCCLGVILPSDKVDRVTVIEVNQDVIDLISPHFPKAEIICADAFAWKPPKGVRYGAVWHDIWPDMCLDFLPEMHKLHRKYGRRTDWQGSWSRSHLEYQRRRGGF